MKKDIKRNNVIIGTLLVILAFMIIGFISLNNQLEESNSNNKRKLEKKNNWNTAILSVEKNKELSTENVVELMKPEFTGTAFSFHVSLPAVSKIVYDVKIKNKGTMDSKFKNILGAEGFNQQKPTVIQCKIEKINQGDTLMIGAIHSFRVTINREYISDEILQKGGTIYFEYQ